MINFQEELEKQMKINKDQETFVKEYKLAEGIYFMDYRQNQSQNNAQSCFEIQENQKKNYIPPKEPIILEADFKEFQKRIDKMKESIEEILQINDWKDDKDFRDAIEENFSAINSNYVKQLSILQKFQELDPCCDVLKKNAKEDILEAISQNKNKQNIFLKEIYGLNSGASENLNSAQLHQILGQDSTSKQMDEEEVENEEDSIASIQDQLNKQKLETFTTSNDKNDNNDQGVFL